MKRMDNLGLVGYLYNKRYVTITSVTRQKVIASVNLTEVSPVVLDGIEHDTGYRPEVVSDPAETMLVFDIKRRKEAHNEN